jgi:glutathione peroxidase
MALSALMFGSAALSGAEAQAFSDRTAHDFSFTAIDGTPLDMAAHAGKAVLVVNTASRCGFTGQYEGMQSVWETYRDRGLVVLAVPSDDFNQELSSEAEIKQFCEVNYSVDFPMTERQTVAGESAHPLFRWFAAQGHGQPRWNFYKYLIDPDGQVVESWSSMTGPTSSSVTEAIEAVLPGSADASMPQG